MWLVWILLESSPLTAKCLCGLSREEVKYPRLSSLLSTSYLSLFSKAHKKTQGKRSFSPPGRWSAAKAEAGELLAMVQPHVRRLTPFSLDGNQYNDMTSGERHNIQGEIVMCIQASQIEEGGGKGWWPFLRSNRISLFNCYAMLYIVRLRLVTPPYWLLYGDSDWLLHSQHAIQMMMLMW